MSTGPAADPATPCCGVGCSTHSVLETAVHEAVAAASAALGPGERSDLAVAFVSGAYGGAVRPALEGLADLVPARVVLGTTAEGVLAGTAEHEGGPSVAIWLARLPGALVAPLAIEYAQSPDGGMFVGWPPELAGAWPDNAALVLLADPFSFPVDALLERLSEDRPGVPIVGGMASGGITPGSNTLVCNAGTYDSGAVGVVVGGAVQVRPVVSQGCRPIGAPLVITRAEANVIHELGGRPALERLREIYGGLAPADRDLVRSSLHVGRVASEYQDAFHPGDFLVRNVVGADPESGVIAIGDLVRTGQTVQFHVRDAASAHADLERLLHAARSTARRPAGALVFTCNGRGTRLFPTPDHDARCVQDVLGPLPAAGFFAQGEIGPIGRLNCLHGFTASIALFEPADTTRA
jgi:small ligand-binding sensory domain FIST